jgi:hypothetical protein
MFMESGYGWSIIIINRTRWNHLQSQGQGSYRPGFYTNPFSE